MIRTRTFLSRSRALGLALAVVALASPVWGEEAAPSPSLMLVGVAEADGVIYASVVDAQTGERFLLNTRAADGGLELVSATAGESAVVRQNGQSFLLRLGWPSGMGNVGNSAPSPAAFTVQNIPRPGADADVVLTPPPGGKVPLVFQSGDMQGLNLTAGQKAIITRLRSQFVAAIGGGGGGASSTVPVPGATVATEIPASSTPGSTALGSASAAVSNTSPEAQATVWETAQEQSDDIFRMLFGYQAFNAYEEGLHGQPYP
jgi:hypothetical protein